MRRTRLHSLLTFFAGAALLAACSGGPDEDISDSGGTGGRSAGEPGTGGVGAGAGGGGPGSGGSSSGGGPDLGTGGTVPVGDASLVIQEGEPAVCGHLAEVHTTISGFTGAGYLSSEEKRGVSVSYLVSVGTAGSFQIAFQYESSEPKSAELRVGHAPVASIEFAPAASFTQHAETVQLAAGENHISLVSTDVAGLVDVDSLSVWGEGVSAGNCLTYAPGADVDYQTPSFSDASVHDPSVINSDGTFYVFGSHLAAAKTQDLMDWDVVAADGVNAENPLFDNVVTELAEAFAYSTVTSLWAADVLQLRSTGRYLMYYNSCEGSSPLSAMGIASSADIEGPYTDDGIFLYSGGGGYNASVLPNAIDPDAFYSPEGELWMVYGSYSGGIFMMKMNPATGFPEEDEEYGTHLLGGNHIQIEGPYIQYSPDTEYYYLFTSYGGLAAGDGYNMRVARATTPRGPYYDHNDVDQATVTSAPFEQSGVKLMGDHEWQNIGGELGYVSPGHNSSYYDEQSGKYFLIFHARFPGQGNFHQIRVHEMWMNVDGWPVVSPLRYAPRTPVSGPASPAHEYVGLSEVPGSYQFVNHGRDTSGTIKTSVAVDLNSDGTVAGAYAGTWRFGGNNVCVLNLGDTVVYGVLARQYNQAAGAFQITFSGVNENGESLGGIRTGD